MKVLAPDCLYRYNTITLSDSGARYAVGLMLDGSIREFRDSIFMEDPVQRHEKYLVHGEVDGSVTLGVKDGFENYRGETIQSSYFKDSQWLVGNRILLDHPYGHVEDRPSDYMCYFIDQIDHDDWHLGCVWWINYQTSASHKDAPYWAQCLTKTIVFDVDSQGRPEPEYGTQTNIPEWQAFYPSLASAITAIRRWMKQVTAKRSTSIRRTHVDKRYIFRKDNLESVVQYDTGRIPDLKNFFRFKEFQWVPMGIYHNDEYRFQHLRQAAFWQAASDIKVLNQNTVSTLVEAIQFLLKLKRGEKLLEVPSSLADLWLSYRYQFNTTKLDLEEGLEFIKWSKIFDLSEDTFFRGSSSYDGIQCRCKLTVKSKFLSAAKDAWSTLYTYGLQPNFYLVWDMTPFSFIADWFIPVGELCDIIDRYNYLTDTFDCVSCVYSLSYGAVLNTDNVTINPRLYSRWVERRFPPVEFCYLYEGGKSSDKTILFRCLDAASLILGRK